MGQCGGNAPCPFQEHSQGGAVGAAALPFSLSGLYDALGFEILTEGKINHCSLCYEYRYSRQLLIQIPVN